MHSSRMHTVRCSGRLGVGRCLPRWVSAQNGVCLGVYTPTGPRGRHPLPLDPEAGTPPPDSEADTSPSQPVNIITDRCKNIADGYLIATEQLSLICSCKIVNQLLSCLNCKWHWLNKAIPITVIRVFPS